jgi:hypothetical protein
MQQQPANPEDKKKFYKAVLALHGDIEALKKNEGNPFFKSKYVPLPDMIDALRPALQKHGFVLSQPVDVAPANGQHGYRNVVFSVITHAETGMSDQAKLAIPDMDDMQKLGGAITYARRYTLSALLGLREVDDDGNTATGRTAKKSVVIKQDKFSRQVLRRHNENFCSPHRR